MTMRTPGSLIFIGLVAVMVAVSLMLLAAAAASVTKRRRGPTSSIERFNVSILPAHTTIIDAAGHGLMSYQRRSISLAGARGGRAKFQ